MTDLKTIGPQRLVNRFTNRKIVHLRCENIS